MESFTYFEFIKNELINTNNHLVQEGLINSVSHTIFTEKLTNLLNKYNIIFNINKNSDSVKLDIQLKKNKFLYDELQSLLNLCGYYISKWLDQNNIENKSGIDIKSFMNNNKMIIFFNKKFDFEETGIKVYMYHVTETKYKDNILNFGLKPKSKRKIENHPDRIYLFDSIDDAIDFSKNIKESVILKVDMRIINKIKLYSDPKYPNYDAFYTYDNIPNFALSEIKI